MQARAHRQQGEDRLTGRMRTGVAELLISLMSRSLRDRSMLHFGSTMRQAAGRSSAASVWKGYSTPPFFDVGVFSSTNRGMDRPSSFAARKPTLSNAAQPPIEPKTQVTLNDRPSFECRHSQAATSRNHFGIADWSPALDHHAPAVPVTVVEALGAFQRPLGNREVTAVSKMAEILTFDCAGPMPPRVFQIRLILERLAPVRIAK